MNAPTYVRIKELREARRMSKARLAREAQISDAYLVQIEQNKRTPSSDVLRKVSTALGLHPLQLIAEQYDYWTAPSLPTEFDRYAEAVAKGDAEAIRKSAEAVQAMLDFEGIDSEGGLSDWALEMEGLKPIAPPEGWSRLHKEDRALFQRLIRKVLTGDDYQ